MSKNIGYMLHHLSAVLARHSDQVLLEQLGIGFSQFKILLTLTERTGLQQKQVAQALGQTEASISRQIKLLDDDGLLTSYVNPNNRREHILRLTPKGAKVTDRAMLVLNNYHAPVFARLSEKQQQQLQDALSTIHQAMCKTDH